MSKMTMNVSFLPGTDFIDAIREAKDKAAMLDVVYIHFKFNDVSCFIGKNCDIKKALNDFADGQKYIVCA